LDNSSSEEDEYDSADKDSAGSLQDFIADEDEPLVTPSVLKKKGNNNDNNK
jgi:hypothetical protein